LSYDLQVITKRQPRASDLTAFVKACGGTLQVEGTFKRGGFVVIREAPGVAVEIDGPKRMETEDVPDAAYGALGRAGWLVEVSVKPSTDASWPNQLAVNLARAADGVVYDPQLDRVTWPAGWRPRDRQSGVDLIDQVALTWCMPRALDTRVMPARVLQLFGDLGPEAIPRRYGDFEPLQHRLEGSNAVAAFSEFWAAKADDWLSWFSWTAKPPCFDGSVNISSIRKYPPGSPTAWVRLSLSFDGRPFARDPAFTDRIVRLFTGVATGLGSFYAAAWVERGIEYRRGRPWSNAMTETGPMPRADAWVGLPPSPTWLAWFGRPYSAAVRPVVAGLIDEERDGGILLRLGAEPKDADELAAAFPPLPSHLLARRRDQPGAWLPGARYTLASGAPSQLAEEIPPLGEAT
jgi:hypothetical protein